MAILPNSLNVCIPDGCSFSSGACSYNTCVNETITQHLGEMPQLLNTTIKFQAFIFFLAVLILFSIVKKCFENKKITVTRFYVKQRFLNSSCTKLFNYLLGIFSNGILHPKIY